MRQETPDSIAELIRGRDGTDEQGTKEAEISETTGVDLQWKKGEEKEEGEDMVEEGFVMEVKPGMNRGGQN